MNVDNHIDISGIHMCRHED